MELTFEPLDLTLHTPFTIFRGTQYYAHNVVVHLGDGQTSGIGEAAPSSHYGEWQATVRAFLEALAPHIQEAETLHPSTLPALLDRVAHLNPAAKAAVDMALYDYLGKRLDTPVYSLLGLDPQQTPRTSFTIGIDPPEVMARKAAEAAQYPVLKVKVGTPHDEEILEAIRTVRPDATIRVDANQAWSPKEAIERINALAIYDLEFVEQPVPAADLEGLGLVTSSVDIPVIADESCIVPSDVPKVAPYVDGINIKLMKCGGLYPALMMIHTARALQLQVMMGCMIESAIAITAAAHLSPLLDYADLDGNLLVDDDPYRGVTVEDGRLILPDLPGLGIEKAVL